jgi:beta-lactamase regulating signal transducer with metallopeptidase domain
VEEPPVNVPAPMVVEVFEPIVMPEVPFELPPVVEHQAPAVAPVAIAPTWSFSEMAALAWLASSGVWLLLAIWRLWRFQRLLRFAQPAPATAQRLAQELADCMRVRCPQVFVLPGNISPMLWTLGPGPRLFVPAGLLERLSGDQLTTLLVHELAHWRRRDDRVRWLELIVLALYWWCPLVWWARRELHQAEEECCDAWVVAVLPDAARTYALTLVETVDFLSETPAHLPLVASGVGRVRLLKRRLNMILQGKTPRALTFTGMLGVAGVGLMMLPLVPGWAQTQPGEEGGQRNQQNQRSGQRDEQNQREEKGQRENQGQKKGRNEGNELDQLRDKVQAMQAELEKRQLELHQRMQQLHDMTQRLRQLEGARAGAAGPGPGAGGPGGIPGGPGGGGGGGNFPGGRPGGFGGKGGGGGGGFGGPGGPGGGPPGKAPMGGGPAPIEQRLADVERKLDMVLQEVRALRGAKGPALTPRPNRDPDPNPRGPGANPAPLAPRGAPVPPTPPAPPGREE